MWKRSDLKQRAKDALRKDYWKAFLISLVIGFAAGGGGSGGAGSGFRTEYRTGGDSHWFENLPWNAPDLAVLFSVAAIAVVAIVAVAMLSFCIRVFIGFPLEVGGRRYFLKTAVGQDNRLCFTFAFQGPHYMKIVLSMLLRSVYNFLWYLLFIVPGIVKSYEYRMVPYILADNPAIGAGEAILASRRMTDGHKFKMFVLDLSFFGWYLIGVLCCFVGVIFLQPYVDMTMAELYLELRGEALAKGLVKSSDLGMPTGAVPPPAAAAAPASAPAPQ